MKKLILMLISIMIFGCETIAPSQKIFGKNLKEYSIQEDNNNAIINFSIEKKYETKEGVIHKGEPIVCTSSGAEQIKQESAAIPGNQEITLTIAITWFNSNWNAYCAPFISFIPEKGKEYIAVNEVIGGKGVAKLWTGVAFQDCRVSIYEKVNDTFKRIETKNTKPSSCPYKKLR